MHQCMAIWREDGIVENIKADQSYHMAEMNQVDRKNFDRNMANIGPCSAADGAYASNNNAMYFLTLHPRHGFCWDREILGKEDDALGLPGIRPTGWDDEDIDHV